MPSSSTSTYGVRSKYGLGDGQPLRARVVREDPPHRVSHREHPRRARPQHPCTSAKTASTEATNGIAPNAEQAASKLPDGNGRYSALACTSGTSSPVAGVAVAGVAQHAGGEVGRDGPRALRRQPARAGGLPAADLQHALAADVAEQPRVGLPHALRAPDEVGVAEEAAVLGLVVVGVGVPPGEVRGGGFGAPDLAVGDGRGAQPVLGRVVAPRRGRLLRWHDGGLRSGACLLPRGP